MDPAEVVKTLAALQRKNAENELFIIKLSEPITSAAAPETRQQRNSDASSSASLDGPTPASLESDLAHYKELFAKLRFSYVEQVTKEKFIRAIVGDPPLIVSVQENLELERENEAAKAHLKALKTEVAEMVAALETKARGLSQRYEQLRADTDQLAQLPAKVGDLETEVQELRATAQDDPSATEPSLRLPLGKTLALVAERRAEQRELARELDALRTKAPRKAKEADRLRTELQPLEARLQSSTAAAREAQRRKEAALGGVADELEQRARWWRASESVLVQALKVDSTDGDDVEGGTEGQRWATMRSREESIRNGGLFESSTSNNKRKMEEEVPSSSINGRKMTSWADERQAKSRNRLLQT
ncbi:Kinetochore protein Sos7 [Ophiocordyceps camponoti-floridani]|uniref:Kinetochore protein Sos7 n=1 Tax=Ophiocordyceps camponoti-floridani TaxID=2030778 RepID=A0A8H4Q887_9HYPO|nr:Kinetochore protein Sos7 [Ophiocordyceps camponoti-floridani]